jgi:hypothetical protein
VNDDLDDDFSSLPDLIPIDPRMALLRAANAADEANYTWSQEVIDRINNTVAQYEQLSIDRVIPYTDGMPWMFRDLPGENGWMSWRTIHEERLERMRAISNYESKKLVCQAP